MYSTLTILKRYVLVLLATTFVVFTSTAQCPPLFPDGFSTLSSKISACAGNSIITVPIIPSGSTVLLSPNLQLTLPTGVHWGGFVAPTPAGVTVSVAEPTVLISGLPTISAGAPFTLKYYVNADFAAATQPSILYKLNYNGSSSCTDDGNPLTIDRPMLNFVSLTPSNSAVLAQNGTFMRTLRFCNDGLGNIAYNILVTDDHTADMTILSATANGAPLAISANNKDMTLTVSNFGSDAVLTKNECIDIVQTVRVNGCGNANGGLASSIRGFIDGCLNTADTYTNTLPANATMGGTPPNLVVASAIVGLDSTCYTKPRTQIYTFTNTGLDTARFVTFDLMQSGFVKLASPVTATLNNVAVTVTPTGTQTFNGSAAALACVGAGAKNTGVFMLPNIPAGKTVVLKFDIVSCCKSTCDAFAATSTPVLKYNKLCGAAASPIITNLPGLNANIVYETPQLDYPTDAKGGDCVSLEINNNNVNIPFKTGNDIVEVVIDVPTGFTPKTPYQFTRADNSTLAPLTSNFSGGKLTLTYKYSDIKDLAYSSWNLDFCTSTCPSCSEGQKNFNISVNLKPAASCVGCVGIKLYCGPAASIYLHCPGCGPGVCQGVQFKNYSMKRISFCQADNNNDRSPDLTWPDTSLLKTRRAMVGDTVQTCFAGCIITSAANPSWTYLYARDTMPLYNGSPIMTINSSKAYIYRNKVLVCTKTLTPSQVVANGKAVSNFDLSVSALTCPGVSSYQNKDSVVIKTKYQVTQNVGPQIIPISTRPIFYTQAAVNSTTRYSCDFWTNTFSILGYSNQITGFNNNPTGNTEITCNGSGPGIRFNANYGGVSNPFPYEFRNFSVPDSFTILVPSGYALTNLTARLEYSGGAVSTLPNILPIATSTTVGADMLKKFYLNSLFSTVKPTPAGKLPYPDETYQLILTPTYNITTSTCASVAKNVSLSGKFDNNCSIQSIMPFSATISDNLSPIKFKTPVYTSNTMISRFKEQKEECFDFSPVTDSPAGTQYFMHIVPPTGVSITRVIVNNATVPAVATDNTLYFIGPNTSVKICAAYTNCNATDIINIDFGYQCNTTPPVNFASLVCPTSPFQLKLLPVGTPGAVQISPTPISMIPNLCEDFEFRVLVRNAGISFLYSPQFKAFIPPFLTYVPNSTKLSWNSNNDIQIADPVISNNLSTFEPNDKIFNFNLSNLTGVFDSLKYGLAGSNTTEVDKKEYELVFKVRASCGYKSNSPITYTTTFVDPCNLPITKDAFGGKLPIAVTNPYQAAYTLGGDLSGIMACGDGTPVNFKATNTGFGLTSNADSLYITLPNSVYIKPGSIANSSNMQATFTKKAFGTDTIYKFKMNPNVAVGGMMSMDFKVLANANAACDLKDTINYELVVWKNALCSATGANCLIPTSAGTAESEFTIKKPKVGFTASTLTNLNTATGTIISINVKNKGDLPLQANSNTRIKIYYDMDNSQTFTAADKLLDDSPYAPALAAGASSWYYKNITTSMPKCPIVAVIMGPCICGMDQQFVSACNTPPYCEANKQWNLPGAICEGNSASFSAAVADTLNYKYSWTFFGASQINGSTVTPPAKTSGTGPFNVKWNTAGSYQVRLKVQLKVFPNGCQDSLDQIYIVNAIPIMTDPADITVECENTSIDVPDFVAVPNDNVSWTWTNNNTSAITLAASGTGQLPIFQNINNTTNADKVATITAYPTRYGCQGLAQTFTVTVKPTPILTTVFPNVLVCPMQFVSIPVFAGSVYPVTSFTWTNSNTADGISSATGSGQIPNYNAPANNTSADIVGTLAVTANFPSTPVCKSTRSFTITIKPTPVQVTMADVSKCPGETYNLPTFSLTPASGTRTFAWTNTNTSVGIAATSGNGQIANYVAPANNTALDIVSTVTVTPTRDGCVGLPKSFNVTLKPKPSINTPANITVCPGETVDFTDFMSDLAGTVYAWSHTNGTVGLAALNGAGQVPTFTATNSTNATIVSNFSAMSTAPNGCKNSVTFNVTVKPKPFVSNLVNNSYCVGDQVVTNFISNPTGATFAWTNSNTNVGLSSANGVGNVPNFNAANATNAAIVSNLTVQSTINGCVGDVQNYTITVKPKPTVSDPADLIVCAGESINLDDWVSNPTGATFNWTNTNPNIGLSGGGTGQIATYNAPMNTSGSNYVGIIKVTPVINGCSGDVVETSVTIKPTPIVNNMSDIIVCPNQTVNVPGFTSIPSTTIFDWTNNNTNTGLSATTGSGNIASFTAAPNNTFVNATSVIGVQATLNNCKSPILNFNITVRPTPLVNTPADITVCANAAINVDDFMSNPIGSTYNWTNDNTNILLNNTGVGQIPTYNAPDNFTAAPIIGNLTVTPTLNTCVGLTQNYKITINPKPTLNQPADITVCAGDLIDPTDFVSNIATANFSWTNNNVATGLAATGTGQITPFNGVNTSTSDIVSTITATATSADGCLFTKSFKITVKPLPSLSGISTTMVCPAEMVNFNFGSNINGATYTWTNNNTAIGLAANGASNISFTSTNATNAAINGTITVISNFNGCNNLPQTYNVTVKPKPILNALSDITACPGSTLTPTVFVSNPTGANFNWSNDNTLVGIGSTGSNQIAPYTAPINNSGAAYIAKVKVTPEINGCFGDANSFNITVNPTPTINNISDISVCPGEPINPIDGITNVSGAVLNWSQTNALVGLAATTGTGQIPTFTAAANTTNANIVSTFTINASANTCTSPTRSFTVTVRPTPTMNTPIDLTKCPSTLVHVDNFASTPTGGSFTWTASNNIKVGLNATGNEQIADYSAPANNSALLQTSNIVVTPELNGCIGLPINFNINIKPTPSINPLGDKIVCPTDLFGIDNFVSVPSGATFDWVNTNTDIGIGTSGTGQIVDYAAPANDGVSNIMSTVIIKPTLAGCEGPTQSFDLAVKPKPTVNQPADVFVCQFELINIDNFVSNISGSTFEWKNDNALIGQPLNGMGQIANYLAPPNASGVLNTANFKVNSNANGCNSDPKIFTVNIYPTPDLGFIPNSSYCATDLVNPIDFMSNVPGATLSWTNNNINTGLPASGTGQIVPFLAAANNTKTNQVSTVSYTYEKDGCVSQTGSFMIIVKPTPTVKATSNITICPNTVLDPDDWTSIPTGATFDWSNNNLTTGLGFMGTGQLPTFTTNPTPPNTDVTSNIFVTPTLNGCVGPIFTYDITVIGQPTLGAPTSVIVCPGENIEIDFVGGSTTTYTWTNTNTAIGLPTSGTNKIIPYPAPANNTLANVMSQITVTPSAASCVGGSQTFDVTIKPTPDINAFADQTVCPGDVITLPFSATLPGTTFDWTNYNSENRNIGLAESGTGNISFTTLPNNSLNAYSTRITTTPTLNGCKGPSKSALLNVKPTPFVSKPMNIVVCAGETVKVDEIISTLPTATINWINNNALIGLAPTGTGQIADYVAPANTTGADIVANITINAVMNSCAGPTEFFTITIKPTPAVNVPANITVCAGATINIDDFVSTPSGATFEWSNDNTKIGLPLSGNGQIATYVAPANNSNVVQTGKLSFQATLLGCKSIEQAFTVNINPTPSMIKPADVVVCPLDLINISTFTTIPNGGNYTWTANNTDTGLPGLSGSGQIVDYNAPTNASGVDYITAVTVTPSLNTCVGLPQTFEIKVKGTPSVAPTQSITVCAGEPIEVNYIGTSQTTFNWVNDNTAIGLPMSGTGSIASYNAPPNNTLSNVVGHLIVTPVLATCVGGNQLFTITIKPTPTVTAPTPVVACAKEKVNLNFTGSHAANTYIWTNDNTNIGLTGTGNGNIDFNTDINNSNVNIVSNVQVTPILNGCSGLPQSTTITNKPTPLLTTPNDIRVCTGEPIDVDNYFTTPAGATFNWTNNNTKIGLPTSGTGDIATYNAPANNEEFDQIASLTVTATLANCKSEVKPFGITIKPTPFTHNVTNITVCAEDLIEVGQFKSTPSGSDFTWTNDKTFIGLAASGMGQIRSFNAPLNPTGFDSIAHIIVTPLLEGCVGRPDTFNIKIKVTPFVNDVVCIEVCPSDPIDIDFVGSPGADFLWSNSNPAIGISGTGLNKIPTYKAPANNTDVPIKGMITVTPSLNSCLSGSQMFEIIVKPTPNADKVQDIEVCPKDSIKVNFVGSITNSHYLWKNTNINIGLPLNGKDNFAYQSPMNNGLTPIHSELVVTPVKDLCYGPKQTVSIDIKPKPSLKKVRDIVVCSGEVINPDNFISTPVGATYLWENTNSLIGIPTSGIGQIATYVAPINNSGANYVAIISAKAVLNACESDTIQFKITVKPRAVVNTLNDITVCAGDSVDVMKLMSNTSMTNIKWTNDNTKIGLPISGTGQIAKFKSVNDSTTVFVSNIYITTSADSCAGEAQKITVTVKPRPKLSQVTNIINTCARELIDIQFVSNIQKTVFTWSANNTAVGQTGLNGTGIIAPFTSSVNNTVNILTTTFKYKAEVDGCLSDEKIFIINIKPTPQLPVCPNIVVCAGQEIKVDTIKSTPLGAKFVWYNDNLSIGLAANDTTNFIKYNAPANNTLDTIKATLTFITYLNGCESANKQFKIMIKPSPSLVATNDITVCPGDTVRAPNFMSLPQNGIFNWTNDNTTTGLATSGIGNINDFKSINKNITGNSLESKVIVTNSLNGCSGINDTFLIKVKRNPVMTKPSDIIVCPETFIAEIPLVSTLGANIQWQNDNPLIGLIDNGDGNVPGFVAAENGTLDTLKATIKIVSSAEQCLSDTAQFRIMIKPTPIVNPITKYALCSQDTLNVALSSLPLGTTFAWSNDNTNIGLAANGNGNISFISSINSSDTAIIGNITVTPTLNGCVGRPEEFKIEVASKVRLLAMDSVVVCAGEIVDIPTFNAQPDGATFSWKNSNTAIGLGTNGNGQIDSYVAPINTTTDKIVSQISVKAQLGSCKSDSSLFKIIINPKPIMMAMADFNVCSGDSIYLDNFSSSLPGAIFKWSNDNFDIGLAPSGQGTISFKSSNLTLNTKTANISIYPSYGACVGAPQNFKINVSGTAEVDTTLLPLKQIVCSEMPLKINLNGLLPNTAFKWENDNPDIGLPTNGDGNIDFNTVLNNTGQAQTATIRIYPYVNGCRGNYKEIQITLKNAEKACTPLKITRNE